MFNREVMSTVLNAAVTGGTVVGVYCLLLMIAKKEKRFRMNKLLNRLSELGSKYNLCFSGQEILHNRVLALDGVHRKLLVITETNQPENDVVLVDLTEVKSCSVKKKYGMIKGGDLTRSKLENFMEQMTLHFEFINEQKPVEVIFYHRKTDHLSRLPVLEQKAKHWEMILSKLVYVPLKKIA